MVQRVEVTPPGHTAQPELDLSTGPGSQDLEEKHGGEAFLGEGLGYLATGHCSQNPGAVLQLIGQLWCPGPWLKSWASQGLCFSDYSVGMRSPVGCLEGCLGGSHVLMEFCRISQLHFWRPA